MWLHESLDIIDRIIIISETRKILGIYNESDGRSLDGRKTSPVSKLLDYIAEAAPRLRAIGSSHNWKLTFPIEL